MSEQVVPPPQPVLSVTLDTPAAAAPAASSQAAPEEPPKRAFPAPAPKPVLQGPKGIWFDFNDGCRVGIEDSGQLRRIRLSDIDTDNILFETQIKSGRVNSSKRYFVRFRIEVWEGEEKVFQHDYSAADREVLVQLPVGTLGDTLGWFPYAVRFKETHGCRLTVSMAEW
ncbi:MAG: autotransporter strand-loop-strand O-heptosyltransferase, partial [Reyranella sp.]